MTKQPFPDCKSFKEQGLSKTRLYEVVIKGHSKFNVGDILEWVKDEDACPIFRRLSDGKVHSCFLYRLAYADDPVKPSKRIWSTQLGSSDGIIIHSDGTITIDGIKYTEDELKTLYGKMSAVMKKLTNK